MAGDAPTRLQLSANRKGVTPPGQRAPTQYGICAGAPSLAKKREGRQPRTLCYVPNGQGNDLTRYLRGSTAADRRPTVAHGSHPDMRHASSAKIANLSMSSRYQPLRMHSAVCGLNSIKLTLPHSKRTVGKLTTSRSPPSRRPEDVDRPFAGTEIELHAGVANLLFAGGRDSGCLTPLWGTELRTDGQQLHFTAKARSVPTSDSPTAKWAVICAVVIARPPFR
jgi:hypothetical protein